METQTLSPGLLQKMDAYWRAANYLSVGQIYLYDNPLLKRPLRERPYLSSSRKSSATYARRRVRQPSKGSENAGSSMGLSPRFGMTDKWEAVISLLPFLSLTIRH